jgi:hypothetical protein
VIQLFKSGGNSVVSTYYDDVITHTRTPRIHSRTYAYTHSGTGEYTARYLPLSPALWDQPYSYNFATPQNSATGSAFTHAGTQECRCT